MARDPREIELLIEEAAGAFRTRDPDGRVRPHPAWADLDESDRRRAHDLAELLRMLEGALDPNGLSSTAHAVLARIARIARIDR